MADALEITLEAEIIERVLDELELAGSPKITYQQDVEKMRAEADAVRCSHLVQPAETLSSTFTVTMRARPKTTKSN